MVEARAGVQWYRMRRGRARRVGKGGVKLESESREANVRGVGGWCWWWWKGQRMAAGGVGGMSAMVVQRQGTAAAAAEQQQQCLGGEYERVLQQ
jgi:hypothetical protein